MRHFIRCTVAVSLASLWVGCWSPARSGPPVCAVTKPARPALIPLAVRRAGLGGSMYGNDSLWVVIPEDGQIRGPIRENGVFDKFPTVRLVQGTLSGEAKR